MSAGTHAMKLAHVAALRHDNGKMLRAPLSNGHGLDRGRRFISSGFWYFVRLLARRRDTPQGEGKDFRRPRALPPLPIGWGEGWGEGRSRATIPEAKSAAHHEDPSPWPSPRPTRRGHSRPSTVYPTVSSVL